MGLLSPMIFKEDKGFWNLWHTSDKPCMWISEEESIKKFIIELSNVYISSWKYRRADIHDYRIMLQLTKLNSCKPRDKLIALEIMK
jgi:hypothetical protein